MRFNTLTVLTALASAAVVCFAEENDKSNVNKNDPNQGHGLRLEANALEKLPADLGETAWEEKMLDFGPDLKRVYQVVVKYAVATKPEGRSDADRGWVEETPQKAAILRGLSLSEAVAQQTGLTPGFHVGLYRSRMNDDEIKRAAKLGEVARILEIKIEEVRVGKNGVFENSKVFEDPNPILMRCASVSPYRGREILFFAESIHPDSKDGQKMKDEEKEEKGKRARTFRARLTVRKDVKRRLDGTYGAPGEEIAAAPSGE